MELLVGYILVYQLVVGTDLTWKRYTQNITLNSATAGKEIEEILDIRMKAWLENCTGNIWITGIQLEIGDYVTDFSPHSEDSEKIAVGYAESQFIQQADLIATKVEQNGVISAINQSAEVIEINANKIDLVGAVTANSISSLNGLNVGNGQFVVDGSGNVTFGGTLNGASGTFTGNIVGGNIETTNDIKVGHNIYLAYEYEKRFDEKGIIFYDGISNGKPSRYKDCRNISHVRHYL